MAGYVGDVAIAYDRDLGHVLFEQYASDIARRTAGKPVRDVLEVCIRYGNRDQATAKCTAWGCATDCYRYQ